MTTAVRTLPPLSLTCLAACVSILPVRAANLSSQIDQILAPAYPPDEPGIAIIVSQGEHTLFRHAYGLAQLELGVSLEPDMVFRLGSITKQFTAAAILLLEEQGKLSVTDPITKHLQDYPTQGHDITIEHLLTHTPGIVSYTGIPGYMNAKVRRDLSTEELISQFKHLPAEFPPGTQYKYNNSGYVLLGAIIERVSGKSYAEFLRENVFQPLGLENSHYGGHQIIPRRVAGYRWNEGQYQNARYLSMSQPHAAGSLLSNVDDLLRWYRALSSGKLISRFSYRRMTTPYKLANGDQTTYGYGLGLGKIGKYKTVQHGGGIFGFSTFALYVPRQEVYVAILSNRTGKGPRLGNLAQSIAELTIASLDRRQDAETTSAPKAGALIQSVEDNNLKEAQSLLKAGANSNETDAHNNTPLHWASLNQNVELCQILLDAGAQVDAVNNHDATPLVYGAGSPALIHLLLKNGANVNQKTKFGSTPLIVAARRPESHAAVQLLLEHGAEAQVQDGAGASPLDIAAQAGDLATVDLLLGQGLKPKNLVGPAMYGHYEIVKRYLEHGIDVNHPAGFSGSALNASLYGQNPEIAKLLIQHGADLTRRSPAGHHETPPIVWSTYNESGDASVATAMLAHGADANTLTALGESALDWAAQRHHQTLVETLTAAGARRGTAVLKKKQIPNNPTHRPAPGITRPPRPNSEKVIAAATKAIRLLEKSSDQFLQSPVVQKQRCVSCHQQTLPALAFGWANDRGIQVNQESMGRLVQDQIRYWQKNDKIAKSYELIRPQPDAPVLLGYGLLGLAALNHPPSELTQAMVRYLLASQRSDGSWPAADYRPPMEDGPIQGTAMAIRSLQVYPLNGLQENGNSQIEKARQYLESAHPVSFNQRVFQILGLHWANASDSTLQSRVDELVSLQRSDGGWAPLPGLESDAWATGQALVALHKVSSNNQFSSTFRAGIEFLLRTQFPDGSWYVKSRAWPFQPHFESGFPHGKDQWISAGGTAWATMALLLTRQQLTSIRTTDWLAVPVRRSQQETSTSNDPPIGKTNPIFDTEIKPLLERSCGACHGKDAKRKKGGFSIDDPVAIASGGQSGLAAIILGKPEESPLVQMITDQIEDLEMPPLGKRQRNPALTRDEIEQIKQWIQTLSQP